MEDRYDSKSGGWLHENPNLSRWKWYYLDPGIGRRFLIFFLDTMSFRWIICEKLGGENCWLILSEKCGNNGTNDEKKSYDNLKMRKELKRRSNNNHCIFVFAFLWGGGYNPPENLVFWDNQGTPPYRNWGEGCRDRTWTPTPTKHMTHLRSGQSPGYLAYI